MAIVTMRSIDDVSIEVLGESRAVTIPASRILDWYEQAKSNASLIDGLSARCKDLEENERIARNLAGIAANLVSSWEDKYTRLECEVLKLRARETAEERERRIMADSVREELAQQKTILG